MVTGKAVVVVGGGETGNDCVQAALNHGAKVVSQLEILPEAAVAGDPTHGRPVGVQRHWSVATECFDGNGHGLQALSATKVRWVHSANGPRMLKVPGGEFVVEADLAVLALGFDAVLPPPLAEQLGLDTDADGRLALKGLTASAAGVFVAGDLATGPALVANAIDTGRKAAVAIEAHLAE